MVVTLSIGALSVRLNDNTRINTTHHHNTAIITLATTTTNATANSHTQFVYTPKEVDLSRFRGAASWGVRYPRGFCNYERGVVINLLLMSVSSMRRSQARCLYSATLYCSGPFKQQSRRPGFNSHNLTPTILIVVV
jgi:hypothetical protein